MLNTNNTNNTKTDHKHTSSRLKRILHCKSNVSPMPHNTSSKDLNQHQHRLTQISSPVLQHSTTLYSLASPTRTSFEMKSNSMDAAAMYYDLYQPLSPPPPVPMGYGRNPRQVPSSSPRDSKDTVPSASTRSRRSHSLHHTNHPNPALFTQSATTLPPLPPTPTRPAPLKKSVTATTTTTNMRDNGKKDTACRDDKNIRRHSCSSTAHHQHHHQHQRYRAIQQQPTPPPPLPSPSAAAVAAALATISSPTSPSTPSLISSASSSNSSLLSKASLANKASSSSSSSTTSSSSTDHHHYSPSLLKLEKSRSTPLRPQSKIKTYNVSPPSGTTTPHHRSSLSAGNNKKRLQRYGSDTTLPSASQLERDLEKKKRQQELEDLISGRRGSTLKLSLTPKNTLLN